MKPTKALFVPEISSEQSVNNDLGGRKHKLRKHRRHVYY